MSREIDYTGAIITSVVWDLKAISQGLSRIMDKIDNLDLKGEIEQCSQLVDEVENKMQILRNKGLGNEC